MAPKTFLSLPRELRQKIILLAVKSSMVRNWYDKTIQYFVFASNKEYQDSLSSNGHWKDNDTNARKLLSALREVNEQAISEDLEWVEKSLLDVPTKGSWKL